MEKRNYDGGLASSQPNHEIICSCIWKQLCSFLLIVLLRPLFIDLNEHHYCMCFNEATLFILKTFVNTVAGT